MTTDTLTQAALDAVTAAHRTGQRHLVTKSRYGFHVWPVTPDDVPVRADPTFWAVARREPRLTQDEVTLAVVHPNGTCTFRSRC